MKKMLAIILALTMLCSFAFAEGVQFATVDTEGNTVTQEIFADYDLTMVNVWATWCRYCIEEMPSFPRLKDSLPEGGNLITICLDMNEDPELVNEMLEIFGANFTTLAVSESLYTGMLESVYYLPTTLFVNSEGEIVGDPFEGMPRAEDPADAYLALFEERLAMLEE